MSQRLVCVGNSNMLTVPSKTVKKRNLSSVTEFAFEEKEDGFFYRILNPQPVFPKLEKLPDIPSDLLGLMKSPVTFSAEERKDPVINRLLDENFR